jgi:hypothetical protein
LLHWDHTATPGRAPHSIDCARTCVPSLVWIEAHSYVPLPGELILPYHKSTQSPPEVRRNVRTNVSASLHAIPEVGGSPEPYRHPAMRMGTRSS